MKLLELLPPDFLLRVDGDNSVEIRGLSYDSRKVEEGFVFFGLAGDKERNRRNIQDALSRGARTVVVEEGQVDARPARSVIIECGRGDARPVMAAMASRFHNAPSRRLDLIGVTGTSGKTTSTYLLKSIFEAAGITSGIIGTIGAFMDHKQIYAGLTTPESLDFESILAEMEERGAKIVAAEISSIGLAQHRVEALDFRAALFTNLGRDHLDYHETAENYFAAKLRLFTELLPRSTHRNPVTVACGDDPFGKRLLDAVQGRKLSFGLAGSLDVHPIWAEIEASGIHTKIQACGREIEVESPLPGEINLLNILAAVAVAAALDIGTEAMIEGLKRCSGAPGRLERVPGPSEVTILVDYAHKPEALAGMLKSLRALGPRRLICVFGCGGDRDRGKRPIMGGIAGRLADLPILTSDNPRSEDPMAIILEVEKGLAGLGLRRLDSARPNQNIGYIVEPERRAAIALAIESAHPGDIVVIAGKGHEDYQLIGGRKLKFDDRQVIREIVAGA